MLGDIGELEAVDALRNLKVGNDLVQKKIEKSVKKFMKDVLPGNALFVRK